MKVQFLEDTVEFDSGDSYHKMFFMVQLFYHDGEPMEKRKMVITYDMNEGSMEFANDDDFYGHGAHFSFGMIKKFKKHLKSLGVDVR